MDIFKQFIKLENEAKEFGFYWRNQESILNQIKSEVLEVEELLQQENYSEEYLQEEIGDLMHAIISLSLYKNFDPKTILEKSITKFYTRFTAIKELAKQEGLDNLKNCSHKKTLDYWNRVKDKSS